MRSFRTAILLGLLMVTVMLLHWSRTNDPRFYAFLETPVGRHLADLFGWWNSPLDRPVPDKPERDMTAQERVVKRFLQQSGGPVTYQDVYLKMRFPYLNFRPFPPYHIFTDAPETQARQIAAELQSLRSQILETFGNLAQDPGPFANIRLLYFSDPREFDLCVAQYAPGMKNVTGFYSPWLNLLAVNDADPGAGGDEARLTLRHEGAHQLLYAYGIHSLHRVEGEWLTEGLASYCETTPLGAINSDRIALLQHAGRGDHLIPLTELINRKPAAGLLAHKPDSEAELTYSEAWGFIHFLMHSRYQAPFFDYIRFVRDPANFKQLRESTPERILCNFLHLEPAELEREWDAYIKAL